MSKLIAVLLMFAAFFVGVLVGEKALEPTTKALTVSLEEETSRLRTCASQLAVKEPVAEGEIVCMGADYTVWKEHGSMCHVLPWERQ